MDQNTDWPNLACYAKANKSLPSKIKGEYRVVMMGNSITERWSRFDPAFFKGKSYINRGISGQTTPQMLLRMSADVVHLNPDAVVILAGINDIAGNNGPMTIETTFDNIKAMIKIAKENQIKVILCSVLPANEFSWRPDIKPADLVIELNTLLKNYATKNHIEYIDYYTEMVDENKGLKSYLGSDGVHPIESGYKIMGPLLEKSIRNVKRKR